MARYVLIRIASAILTLLGVSVFVFAAIHLAPGRFEDIVLGPNAPPESKAAFAASLGLNRPLPDQYASWLLGLARGDFGTSLISRRPITDEFLRRVPVTAELTLISAALSALVGVPVGMLAAFRGREAKRAWPRVVGAATISVPSFVLGGIFVYVFSRYSLGLTVGGFVPMWDNPVANLQSVVLPAVTLSVFGMSLVMRTTRDAVMEVLTQPFVTAEVARGKPPLDIVRLHVLRNAAIPIVTVLATNIGYLMGGAVVVELLFSLPGLGRYMLDAVSTRDYPAVEAGVMAAAAVFIALNMFADLAYVVLDPRIGSRTAST